MQSQPLYGAHVHVNGIRQHYLRYGGRGRPLILIPGITSPAPTMGFVAAKLADRFDVYVLDVRGRGLSSSGPDLAYDLDTYAQDVRSFAAALGLESYVLIGHSMGARIGIRLATLKDEFLSALVLVDPPLSGPGRRPYPSDLSRYLTCLKEATAGMSAEQMRAQCPTWSDDHLRVRAEWFHTCDETAIVTSYRGFHEEDIFGDMNSIAVPALLVGAEKGDVIRPEEVAELTALCPHLQFQRVAMAGHMIPWDNFDGFLEAIDPFLSNFH